MKYFFMFILFLNSQVFFFSGGNQLGIRGAQEVFIGFLILFTLVYVLGIFRTDSLDLYDHYVLVVTSGVFIFSSLLALIKHGQPLFYGMIESRVTLSMLIYFPIIYMIRKQGFGPLNVMRCVFYMTFGIVFFGVLIKFNLFPRALLVTPPIDSGESILRLDRNSMGRYYVIISALFAIAYYNRTQKLIYLGSFLVFLLAALFIVQERQNVIGIVMATLVFMSGVEIINGRISRLIKIFVAIGLMIGVVYFIFPNLAQFTFDIFSKLSSEGLVESLRYRTIETIFDELRINFWQGHGTLSLLWNNGYHRLYGTFFIGDVGVIGTLFRLGIPLSIFLWLYSVFIFLHLIKRVPTSAIRDLGILSILFIIFTMPTSAPIEYRGYFVGLVFALLVSMNRYSRGQFQTHNSPR